ncbi:MAG: RNA-binding protein [Rhizobiaceae bacterium]
MNERTCIVTRRAGEADSLIRFVRGPDGSVVPDLKRNLPGRGCWVTADRAHVDRAAAAKKLFVRALKADVTVPPDLGEMVDGLLARAALGALGLARKAGSVVLGAVKVEDAVRKGTALLVLHADEASEDGVRRIASARRATVHAGGPDIPAYKLFSEADLGLAFGGTNVIHAAVLADGAGRSALKRVVALDRFRGGFPEEYLEIAAVADVIGAADNAAAEDVE